MDIEREVRRARKGNHEAFVRLIRPLELQLYGASGDSGGLFRRFRI
ncbi:hypothetical protein [Paenibacillus dendritiformis]|nr:hypothetical protein [Paenibacillus dendritiformis]CAH8768058.1 hypothetical protein H7S4_000750 [Paenibacillus dendritiformis]